MHALGLTRLDIDQPQAGQRRIEQRRHQGGIPAQLGSRADAGRGGAGLEIIEVPGAIALVQQIDLGRDDLTVTLA